MDKTSTHSLDDTLALMRDLRKRCEWDAAQTHESLRPYLIEEAHELDDAIRLGGDDLLREELGDLLLQVLFHSVLAEERGAFAFADVAQGLITKMKARHPHLYGDAAREPWEKMKSKDRKSIADGLPAALPALHRTHRLQDRAAGVGFDWPDVEGPAAKVEEELGEVRSELKAAPPPKPGSPPLLDERHYSLPESGSPRLHRTRQGKCEVRAQVPADREDGARTRYRCPARRPGKARRAVGRG